MARTRDDQGSLFPFLSVLSCVIGTLALLIAALAFSQIAADLAHAVDDPALRDGDGRGEKPDAEAATRAAALEGALATLEGTRAELRALGIDPDAPPDERRATIEARAALLELQTTLPSLDREASALRARRTGLEGLVPEAMQPSDEEAGIALLPSGSGALLNPYFVECREGAIRFHDIESGESNSLDLDDPLHRGRYERFLRRVREEPGSTVVFLIRPDGVPTYDAALLQAGYWNVRHAKLPLPGFGPLDFSAL